MSHILKPVMINITDDKPLDVTDIDKLPDVQIGQREQVTILQLGETVKAYLDCVRNLLSGKYSDIKNLIPPHLADPGNVLVAYCPSGVVIRYERQAEDRKLYAGYSSESLTQVAAFLSQNVIRCYEREEDIASIPPFDKTLQFSITNNDEQITEVFGNMQVGFEIEIKQPTNLPVPPHKPFCLLAVRNSLEIQLRGELTAEEDTQEKSQQFLMRSIVRIPVGWECIEVYPFFDAEFWKPEYASVWAENDLLAAVASYQVHEAQFQSLDSKAGARKEYAELLNKYKTLLDSKPDREEILHQFLNEHPELLSPTRTKTWSKLALGAHKTDFVFREANGDYLLVELERSTLPLFTKRGELSRHVNHALNQITDWKRYLEDNLSTVQRELGLIGISANPNSLIVIGRSQNLTPENKRKLVTHENEKPKTKILTYDDVYDNAKAVVENLLGPLWETIGRTQVYFINRH